jgi:hypothetical protein
MTIGRICTIYRTLNDLEEMQVNLQLSMQYCYRYHVSIGGGNIVGTADTEQAPFVISEAFRMTY